MNILKEITTTLPTQDSPTGSISKRSSRSCKKERERTVMNVLRETHPPQTRKNSPIGFISKRIQKSSSPRDPFLQKRTLTNVFKETITTLPIQDSLTDSLPKRIRSVPTKKKEKRTLTNILKETTTTPSTQDSPTNSISKRIRKSPSPRDPFLQKRMLMNVLKETTTTLPT